MDIEKSNLITEQLLQAMEIIANKKIENLPFDKTILCTIDDIIDEAEGIYEVSFSGSQAKTTHFTAYAQEGTTYQIGDNVYINIPQNDFSQQKTIISKYITEQTSPINYISPMEKFIKIYPSEENNWIWWSDDQEIGTESMNQTWSLLANGNTSEKLIFTKIFANNVNQFDCLGVSAFFKSLLGDYYPIDGEYGLRFEFIGLKDGWDIDTENLENYYVYKTDTFSNKNMYGMIYGFKDYQQQEKLINLQDFPYPIKLMRVFFYQDNSFFDQYGKRIHNNNSQIGANISALSYNSSGNTWSVTEQNVSLTDDLYVKDLVLSFGYLVGDAQDKELRLYTTSISQYAEDWEEENEKHLKLRWLEQNDEGNFITIDQLSDKFIIQEDDTIDKSFWNNKSIYLYKYTYSNDEPDEYAGMFWKKVWGQNEINAKNLTYYQPQSYKAQISSGATTYILDTESYGVASEDQVQFHYNFTNNPFEITININTDDKQSAFVRYKMIIVETSLIPTTGLDSSGNEITYYIIQEDIYESNEITFENRDQVASMATMALIQGLELECSDGTNGIYRIYGEDNKISAQINSREMKLQANFKAVSILNLSTGGIDIIWEYPRGGNTMFLEPVDTNDQIWIRNEDSDNYDKLTREQQNRLSTSYFLYEHKDLAEDGIADAVTPIASEINYTISSFYSSLKTNNTIKCSIARFGRIYEAEMNFSFGHQGNNGTNYAFDIAFEREYEVLTDGSSKTAREISSIVVPFLKCKSDNNNIIKIKPTLIYGQEEITDLDKIHWSWLVRSTGTSGPHVLMYDENFESVDSFTTGSCIYIKSNVSVAELDNFYAILEAKIEKSVVNTESTTNNSRNVTLSTYLPLGIARDDSIKTYMGGTSILYNDYGSDPVYYEGEHKLEITSNPTLFEEFRNSDNIYKPDLIDSSTWIYSTDYYPLMYKGIDDNKWYIRPTIMYFSDINNTGRIIIKENDVNGNILYVQSILIAQNAWGNQTINQWDGNLKIDEEGNYILSSMLGAGKKNDNNTFSGVLLGQVGKSYSDLTGIYGYHEGVQTYGFREDGTAFIGASGASRIDFDGSTQKGTISGGQNAILKEAGKNEGYTMTIDLAEGTLIGIQQTPHTLIGTEGNSKGFELYVSKLAEDTNVYYKKNDTYYGVLDDQVYTGNVSNLKNKVDHYEYIFDAQAETYPLKIGENFKVSWNGTLYASNAIIGNAFGDLWSNISSNTSDEISIEEYLYEIYSNLNAADIVQAEKEAADLSAEAAARQMADDVEAQLRASEDLTERTTREFEFSPNQLYDSVIRASSTGSGNKYILVANTTYGADTSHTQFLLDGTEANGGTLGVNNLVANGVITSYAGSFGGWNLLPGLMYYGYNTSAIQTQQGFTWIGDFFSLPNNITINQSNTAVNLEDFKNAVLTLQTQKPPIVDATKAFIFLGNHGEGISIQGFNDASTRYDTSGNTYGATTTLPTTNDIEHGYLKNIIFSLGKYFAVDYQGQLFASSGTFSGKVTASSGRIGGWTLNEYSATDSSKKGELTATIGTGSSAYTITLDPSGSAKIVKDTDTTWENLVFAAGSNFGVAKDGKLYASDAVLTGSLKAGTNFEVTDAGVLTALSGTIGGFTLADGKLTSKTVTDEDDTGYFYINPNDTTTSNVAFRVGKSFYVTADGTVNATGASISGTITALQGRIGGWTLNEYSTTDSSKKGELTSNIDSSYTITLDPSGSAEIIKDASTNTKWSNLVFAAGSNFGVTKDGTLYCSGANISGTLTASHIQGKPAGTNNDIQYTVTLKHVNETLDHTSYPYDKEKTTTTITYKNGEEQTQVYVASDNTNKITKYGNVYYRSEYNYATYRYEWTEMGGPDTTYTTYPVFTRALSLNTDNEKLGFWNNALFGGFSLQNSSHYFSQTYEAYKPKSYVGFIRGAGTTAYYPGNVFLGIKAFQNSVQTLTADQPSSNWTSSAFYRAFIKYSGQAKFFSISIGNGGTSDDGSGSELVGSTSSVEFVLSSSNKPTFDLITTYGITENGDAYFKNIRSNLTTTEYIGLTLNGADNRSTTNPDYFWQNSLYTMRGDGTNHYVAFLRGYGPDSANQTNVFLGGKTLAGAAGNLWKRVTGFGNDRWTSPATYNFYIKYNGEAYFQNIKWLGSQMKQSKTISGVTTNYLKTIGLTLNNDEEKTSTNKDYFWKNSLYTMRAGAISIPAHKKFKKNNNGTYEVDSEETTATTTDNYGYVAFIRGFGPDSATQNMTFIGAKKSVSAFTDGLSKNVETSWVDWWSNPSNSNFTFKIDIDGNATFKTLTITDAVDSDNLSLVLPKYGSSQNNYYLKVTSYEQNGVTKYKTAWSTIPDVTDSASGLMTTSLKSKLDGIADEATKNNIQVYINNQLADTRANASNNDYFSGPFLKFYDGDDVIGRVKFVNGDNTTVTGKAVTYNGVTYPEIKITATSGGNTYYEVSTDHTSGLVGKTEGVAASAAYTSGWFDCSAGVQKNIGSNGLWNEQGYQYAGGTGYICYYAATTSDKNLKKNFKNISSTDLAFYDSLCPQSFQWKSSSLYSYGFIAQDVEQLLNQYSLSQYTICTKDIDESMPDGILYGLNDNQFHALHAAKNHQQDARIQSLESEVASLRAELEQLKREKGGN